MSVTMESLIFDRTALRTGVLGATCQKSSQTFGS
jgi:hypothetical protein